MNSERSIYAVERYDPSLFQWYVLVVFDNAEEAACELTRRAYADDAHVYRVQDASANAAYARHCARYARAQEKLARKYGIQM